ncbi:MAG: hypothetical protein KatS3mg129_1429 [Leptospiraceae bacterium]|nr:MAG: hypothetical protein KatS3mg129_1429 [Leptospiraceae bacterium]
MNRNIIIIICLIFVINSIYSEIQNIKNQKTNIKKEKILTEEEFTTLVNKIKYLNTTERIYTIKSLEKFTENDKKKFYDLLAEISLNDADPIIKEKALEFIAIEKADCKKCIEAYKKNLFSKEEKVQLQALKGIENLQLKDLKKEMVEILNKTDFSQNGIFINALLRTLGNLKYNQKEITDILLEKYKSEDTHQEIKRTILLYAGASENLVFKDILKEIIEKDDEDIYLRAYAVNSIGKLAKNWKQNEKKEIINQLKKIYNDILSISNPKERVKYNPLKQHIILSLIRLGDDSIKEELKQMALDDDANVRLKALEYIEDLELKEYKEMIEIKYKYDPSKSVKNKAKEILKKWGELKE